MQSITLEKLLCERLEKNFYEYKTQAHRNWKQLLNTQLETIESRAMKNLLLEKNFYQYKTQAHRNWKQPLNTQLETIESRAMKNLLQV